MTDNKHCRDCGRTSEEVGGLRAGLCDDCLNAPGERLADSVMPWEEEDEVSAYVRTADGVVTVCGTEEAVRSLIRVHRIGIDHDQ